jgi:RND family efflux transporter MFP subunit
MSDLTSDLASLKIQRTEDPNRPRPWRTVVLAVIGCGAAVAAYVFGYPLLEARLFKMEVGVTEIATLSPAQASVTVTSTGYVVPQIISKVGTKIPGRVAKVLVKEGSVVKAGDVLAELESTDQKSSIAAANARAASANARIDTARANWAEIEQQVKRDRALVEKGAIGKAALDDLEARARSLEQSIKAAEAEAQAAQADVKPLRAGLDDHTVRSPIDGTVISKPIESGELVGPQMSNIAEVADFRSLMVETDVPEGRLYLIKEGGPCEISLDAYPGKRYRGQTVEIGHKVDRAKATVTVKVKFVDSTEGALPDMSARTSFLSEELSAEAIREKPKTVVPAIAIRERDGNKFVFVVVDGVVREKPVKVGPPFGGGFELIEGPQPGTRVVSNPPPSLSDGQRIKEKGS